jgi:hypothetical protein
LEHDKLISAHAEKPLKGTKIFITADSDDLYNYWKPVLMAAQAILLKPTKKGKGKEDIPAGAQVIVTDATCNAAIVQKAFDKAIPLVKPEWLVQTIIMGTKVDFHGHEKYRVEAQEDLEDEDDDEEEDEDDEDEDQS